MEVIKILLQFFHCTPKILILNCIQWFSFEKQTIVDHQMKTTTISRKYTLITFILKYLALLRYVFFSQSTPILHYEMTNWMFYLLLTEYTDYS